MRTSSGLWRHTEILSFLTKSSLSLAGMQLYKVQANKLQRLNWTTKPLRRTQKAQMKQSLQVLQLPKLGQLMWQNVCGACAIP